MKQTAVEWLAFKFSKSSEDELVGNINIWFGQAIQLEKQQQDELAIDFIKWTISQEAEDLIDDLKMIGEVSKIPTPEEILKVYKRFKNK
jgi:ABC-type thiamine transport system substrate-binding protein